MKDDQWRYAFGDEDAFLDIRARIERAGSRQSLITYSDLVAGVEFRLPQVTEQPLVIDVHAWRDIDRIVVGEILGRISMESYRSHGFMASALAVGQDGLPSLHFFKWMRKIGALRDRSEDAELTFWSEQVRLAHAHYGGRTG